MLPHYIGSKIIQWFHQSPKRIAKERYDKPILIDCSILILHRIYYVKLLANRTKYQLSRDYIIIDPRIFQIKISKPSRRLSKKRQRINCTFHKYWSGIKSPIVVESFWSAERLSRASNQRIMPDLCPVASDIIALPLTSGNVPELYL